MCVCLCVCCRSDSFENPVIQQHFRNLEALALDMMAPENIEDFISTILLLYSTQAALWLATGQH